MQYLFLLIAIISELIGTTLLKLSNGFSIILPSIGTLVFYTLSFYFLSLTLKTIEVGVAYAIWCSIGMSIMAIIGVLFFNETISLLKIISLILIIVGVVGLNLSNITH